MRTMIALIGACFTVAVAPVQAQRPAPSHANACIRITDKNDMVTVTGKLIERTFPGPPNYEAVALGDEPEPAYILLLPRPTCLDDGGNFADAKRRFTTVHIYAGYKTKGIDRQLRASVGKLITVTGEGFGLHTGHHRAPLVIGVKAVTMR